MSDGAQCPLDSQGAGIAFVGLRLGRVRLGQRRRDYAFRLGHLVGFVICASWLVVGLAVMVVDVVFRRSDWSAMKAVVVVTDCLLSEETRSSGCYVGVLGERESGSI